MKNISKKVLQFKIIMVICGLVHVLDRKNIKLRERATKIDGEH